MSSIKRTTSIDVAKMAGVSRTTVSFVLNDVPGVNISEPTRQRVQDAVKTLNYHPDVAGRRLASGKSNTIGLVMRQSAEQVFADAFLIRVVLGVEGAVAQQGFHVLIKPVEPDDHQGYARLTHENYVDGILLSGPREDDTEIIRMHHQGVPVMLMGQLPNSEIPFVDVNAIAGAANAVRHLIAQGHHQIAMITNAPLTYTSAKQRREGYHQALREAGLKINDSFLREGNYTPASGFKAMTELLKVTPRPTAIFVASDVVAMGAIQAIKGAALRVPDDVAVIGFDDVPLAEYCDPPLTTIRLPAYGLGWAAGDRLVRMIQGESLEQPQLFLESELVIRQSTL